MLRTSLKWGFRKALGGQSFTRYHCNNILTTQPQHSFAKYSYYALRSFSSGQENLYDILGISRSATLQEIKKAYFHEAKKHHPDLNPNDPKATARFQKLSSAYEVLSDPTKRKKYDSMGDSYYQQYKQNATTSEAHSRDTFNDVWEDIDVLKEAWKDYYTETKEELDYAVKRADEGDFAPLWNIVDTNKFVILGVLVPVVAIFRFPALIGAAVRVVAPFAWAFAAALLRSGHAPVLASYLWRKMIGLAKRRRSRKK